MPCKVQKLGHGDMCGETNPILADQNTHASWSHHESTRKRIGKTQHKDNEDRIAGKGFHSLSHYNVVHKFGFVRQAMKILGAKAAAYKEWEKLEKMLAWRMTKVRSAKSRKSIRCNIGTQIYSYA